MKDCKHKHTELDGTCLGCGLTEEWRTIESLKEEVRDLKARLKSIRSAMGRADFPDHGVGYCQQPDCALCREYKTTDLRVKKWRKP